MVLAGSFHLSEASNIFLIHRIRVVSGRSAASDLEWFAASCLGYSWRKWRWQWGIAVASTVTGMSMLLSYRHTQVHFKIPCLSLGCGLRGLRGHNPVLGLTWCGMLAGHCGYLWYPRTLWLASETTRGWGPWLQNSTCIAGDPCGMKVLPSPMAAPGRCMMSSEEVVEMLERRWEPSSMQPEGNWAVRDGARSGKEKISFIPLILTPLIKQK